jgi:hypothetical protein
LTPGRSLLARRNGQWAEPLPLAPLALRPRSTNGGAIAGRQWGREEPPRRLMGDAGGIQVSDRDGGPQEVREERRPG